MAGSGSNQKIANSLVAMSSAAVLAVYSAGYVRTRPAADRVAKQALERTLARQLPPTEAVHDSPATRDREPEIKPAAPMSSAAIAHPDPKPKPAVVPKPSEPGALADASIPLPNAGAAPSSPVTPEPAAVTSLSAVAEPPASVPAPPAPAPKTWKDGKYVGWGGSRHGDIEATVVIEAGRIVSAEISNCQTRYPCDVIEKLPPQVITRQSPNVQRVSGATESADAFYSAVYFALKQAQ